MLIRFPAAFWGRSATVLQRLGAFGKATNILRSTTAHRVSGTRSPKDLHLQVSAPAGRTQSGGHPEGWPPIGQDNHLALARL